MPLSEDFTDEVEAINSIYGPGTLVLIQGDSSSSTGPAGQEAVLALPSSAEEAAEAAGASTVLDDDDDDDDDEYGFTMGSGAADKVNAVVSHRLRLRLRFPPGYPADAEAPAVLAVQSAGEGRHRPGVAARDMAQFRAAVQAAFRPGQVCLYDAVEDFMRQMADQEEAAAAEAAAVWEAEEACGEYDCEPYAAGPELSVAPVWTVSDPFIELRSVFVARCAAVSSPAQAAAFLAHLKATDRRVRLASHNMTAWRIRGTGSGSGSNYGSGPASDIAYQDCDDDGETAAGGRLLHLMQLMDLWNVMVVVTRWYGGHHLGPRRFALINQAARDAFVKAGLVADSSKKKHK